MNPATGDFVFGVSEGFLIEDGAVDHAGPRREPDRPRDRGHERGRRRRRRLRHLGGRLRQGRPGRARWAAARRRCASRGSRWEAPVPDLGELSRGRGRGRARRRGRRGLRRGVAPDRGERAPRRGRRADVRGVARRRRAADRATAGSATRGPPTRRSTRCATPSAARARTPRSPSPTSSTCSPPRPSRRRRCPSCSARIRRTSRPTRRCSWRSTWSGARSRSIPRVTKIDAAQVGDAVVARRDRLDRRRGTPSTRGPTPGASAVTLAVEGDETQTGFSFTIAPRPRRRSGCDAIADEAVRRAASHAGRGEAADREGPGGPRPVRRDVVPGRAGGRAQRRGRAEGPVAVRRRWSGQQVGSELFTLVDDGTHHRRPRRLPVRRRGRAQRADRAVHARAR